MSFVTNIVLTKIKDAIKKHAKENEITEFDLYIKIFPLDEQFTPGFELCHRTKTICEITFSELIGIREVLGFNVAEKGEEWIQKFLTMSATDNEIDYYDSHFYFIRIEPVRNALQAYMYKDNKPFKEVTLEYIFKTT